MRALIADCDPERLRQLESWLTRWAHDVVPAKNGVEAWSRLSAEKEPILAILAWDMEGMSGTDVCRKLRLQPDLPSAYVLLLAESRGAEDLLEGLERGRGRLPLRAAPRAGGPGARAHGRADR
jgi:two-component system phosphate regulon response regulator PhoB